MTIPKYAIDIMFRLADVIMAPSLDDEIFDHDDRADFAVNAKIEMGRKALTSYQEGGPNNVVSAVRKWFASHDKSVPVVVFDLGDGSAHEWELNEDGNPVWGHYIGRIKVVAPTPEEMINASQSDWETLLWATHRWRPTGDWKTLLQLTERLNGKMGDLRLAVHHNKYDR